MMKNVPFIWTTFHNDAACCVQSVGSAVDLGVSPRNCIVFENIAKPVRDAERSRLFDLGVDVRPAHYSRRETYEDLQNMMVLCSEVMRDYPKAEWFYQLDSDIVLAGLTHLSQTVSSDCIAMAGSAPHCNFSGWAWACRRNALETLCERFVTDNPVIAPCHTPDDSICGEVLDEIHGEDVVIRHPRSTTEPGYSRGWFYEEDPLSLQDLTQWDVLHFGQRREAGQAVSYAGQSIRERVAEEMEKFRQLLPRPQD